MRPVILYRGREFETEEKTAAEDAGFVCTNSRMDIRKNDLVIGRYSVLPFYSEQERDIRKAGARLINSLLQHQYIADLQNWYSDLEKFTPKTWFSLHEAKDAECSFVLKGETNSMKQLWDTHMFADTWKEACKVYNRLQDDGLIGSQKIYLRKYVPLTTFIISFQGQPITEEYRFFICGRRILSGAFYWSSHYEDIDRGLLSTPGMAPFEATQLALKVADIVQGNAVFYVVDVARTDAGEWILIELNDGQMSGLSMNNPRTLYSALANELLDSNS